MIIPLSVRSKLSNFFPPAHYIRGRKNRLKLNLSSPFGDEIITRAVESGEAKLIGRLGGTEARVLSCYLDIFKGKSIWDPLSTLYSLATCPKRIKQLKDLSGVYPLKPDVLRIFVKEQYASLLASDVIGVWGWPFTWVERVALKKVEVGVVPHESVAPWVEVFEKSTKCTVPWSQALNGKTVLIISGFSKSFSNQHARIEKIFPEITYPQFKAKFITAPISLGGIRDGKTWVHHLERMKNEMGESDFDVALISAGAYALPLAHHAKKLGKVGIACGGELQLFFGVLGNRWELKEKVKKYKNEYWIRPSEDERPANWRGVEDGCYW
jgi:hypothetical protein